MDMFQRRRLVVGLVAFAVLFLVALLFAITRIQDDRTAAAERQLRTAGITDVDVSFSGRDGTLEGPAAEETAALAAIKNRDGMRSLRYVAPTTTTPGRALGPTTAAGSNVAGATTAAAPTTGAPAPAPLQVTANVEGSQVTLGGSVASDAEKKALVDAATASFGAGKVVDQVAVAGTVRDPATAPALAAFTAYVGGLGPALRSGSAQLAGPAITAAGTAFSKQAAAALNQRLQQIGASGVSVSGGVQDPAPATDGAILQAGLNDLVGRTGINFASGSAVLDARSKGVLDTSAQAVLAGPTTTRIEIDGHTDNIGAATQNDRLSLQRAQAVRLYLIGKGVAAARLEAKGFGATKPIADNATAEGRAQNRRIEFKVLGS